MANPPNSSSVLTRLSVQAALASAGGDLADHVGIWNAVVVWHRNRLGYQRFLRDKAIPGIQELWRCWRQSLKGLLSTLKVTVETGLEYANERSHSLLFGWCLSRQIMVKTLCQPLVASSKHKDTNEDGTAVAVTHEACVIGQKHLRLQAKKL